MKRKRNVAILEGTPGQWAIVNNSLKNTLFRYVQNIMPPNNARGHFNSYFRNRGRNYVAMNNNGAPVGFAILGPNRPTGTTRLFIIGTQPGHGFGSELLAQIENNARGRGVYKLRIMDPVGPARNFYKYMGYRVGANQNGIESMYKKLKRRRSPSHPSPARPASSPGSSARRPAPGQTPHPKAPRRNSPRRPS